MRRDRLIALGLAVLLGLLAAAAYAPTTHFPFVRFDDDVRLVTNDPVRAGLSGQGLYWAFTSMWAGSWSPISWISHMLDFTLYAGDAGGHHATNVVLHALNVVLLFALLRAASGHTLRSACVALLLAIHPIHVETVAWVSERKGLLSSGFAFASLWCYVVDAHRAQPRFRTLSLFFLALGLMAKPMLVSVPFVMLLLERLRSDAPPPAPLSRRLLSIWPWLAMSAVSVAITVFAQEQAGTLRDLQQLPLLPRVENALVTSVLYLWKLAWPTRLSALYPHPYLPGGFPWSPLQVVGAAAFWIAVGALAWRSGHRALRIGLLWYAVTLLPVLGLVQVGSQAMADRYAYLPAIGIYLAAVWGIADLLRGRGRALSLAAAGAGVAAAVALAWAGQRQIQVWRSSESLFRHAVEVDGGNFSMHFNLANTLKGRGQVEQAIAHYRAAVTIYPGMARAHYNLANTLVAEDRIDEAIEEYRAAVAARPDLQIARNALGRLLVRSGDLEGSLAHFREEVERRPGDPFARLAYAQLLRMSGDLAAAADAYDAAAGIARDGERWKREAQALRAQLRAQASPEAGP